MQNGKVFGRVFKEIDNIFWDVSNIASLSLKTCCWTLRNSRIDQFGDIYFENWFYEIIFVNFGF